MRYKTWWWWWWRSEPLFINFYTPRAKTIVNIFVTVKLGSTKKAQSFWSANYHSNALFVKLRRILRWFSQRNKIYLLVIAWTFWSAFLSIIANWHLILCNAFFCWYFDGELIKQKIFEYANPLLDIYSEAHFKDKYIRDDIYWKSFEWTSCLYVSFLMLNKKVFLCNSLVSIWTVHIYPKQCICNHLVFLMKMLRRFSCLWLWLCLCIFF